MKILKGNLLDLAEQGHFDIILHGCNCQNTMKSGIAGEIARRYPQVVEVDQKTTEGDLSKLGKMTISRVQISDTIKFFVANLYTQFNYGRDSTTRYVDYWAVEEATHLLKIRLIDGNKEHFRIGYPKIGCGLANGDWEIVSEILERNFKDFDHTLVVLE